MICMFLEHLSDYRWNININDTTFQKSCGLDLIVEFVFIEELVC